MAIKLTITELGDPSTEYGRGFVQDRVLLGRARSADVCLPDMAVSTRHAEIRLKEGDYVVVDLASVNGTLVNGKPLIAHRPHKLRNGDVIGIAGFRVVFTLGALAVPSESRDVGASQARQMLARMLAVSGQTTGPKSLVVVGGPGKASRFDLPDCQSSLIIGRGRECEISIDDPDLSRRHAELLVESDGIFVRDLKSRNGLIVGGERREAIRLEEGLKFVLGGTTLALEQSAERSLSAIFDAPEESTSSYAMGSTGRVSSAGPSSASLHASSSGGGRFSREPRTSRSVPPGPPENRSSVPSREPVPLAVGPSDPLVRHDLRPGEGTGTGDFKRPGLERGSDLGLIIVGAIIVVAAVIGLVLLFT